PLTPETAARHAGQDLPHLFMRAAPGHDRPASIPPLRSGDALMSAKFKHPGAPPQPSCHLPAPEQPAQLWLAVWPSAADGISDPRDAGLAIAEAARILARDTQVAMLARAGDLADASMRCGAGVGVSSWEGSLACFADRRPS